MKFGKSLLLGFLGLSIGAVATRIGEDAATDEDRNLQVAKFSLWTCFSSHATAEVNGRGKVAMSDLVVGDEVLTGNGDYEPIYSIAHRHPTKSANFFQIHTSMDEEPLEITEKHMIFLEGNHNPIPAEMVKVGDRVQTLDGSVEVSKISTVSRNGVFNPVTKDGTIVVNGIKASVFSSFFGDEWIEVAGYKVMTWQGFFERATKPYRYMCTGISLELCKTSNERVGILQLATDIGDHWAQQGEMYQIGFLSLLLSFVAIVDLMLSPCGCLVAAISLGYAMSKKVDKKKTL